MPAGWRSGNRRTRSGRQMAQRIDSQPTPEQQFRGVAGRLPTGVSVVVTLVAGEPLAATASSVVAASWSPPLLAVLFSHGSRIETAIAQAGRFTVSVLGETDHGLARRFARSDRSQGWDAFADLPLQRRDPGPPVLTSGIVWADCVVVQAVSMGDHHCFVGEVLETASGETDTPLIYYRGRLRALGPAVAPATWTTIDEHDLTGAW
jgi:3-hydroxy-9,10-secoandrosta-1,3,5(10)-triene-9,17-dione monooxygenase reductase component